MGYANTMPYQNISLTTGLRAIRTITSVASDQDIADFVIPSFMTPPSHAYLDVLIHTVRDTAGLGGNSLQNSGSYGIYDSTHTTYTSSNSISSDFLTVSNNGWFAGYFILPGVTNIVSAITPGATQTAAFKGIQSVSNDLMLYGVMAQLRLYFNM